MTNPRFLDQSGCDATVIVALVASILVFTPPSVRADYRSVHSGKDGSPSRLTGTVNTYYPASGDIAAGATAIESGGASLAARR